jgi:hypothetical protein
MRGVLSGLGGIMISSFLFLPGSRPPGLIFGRIITDEPYKTITKSRGRGIFLCPFGKMLGGLPFAQHRSA